MTLNTQAAPHIRYHENTRILMLDVIAVLMVVYAMAFYYYGSRVLTLGLVGIVSAVVTDIACIFVAGKRPNIRDLSPVVTGMLLPLMMPAVAPYYLPAVAAVVAIMVAKHPFGGVGHNVFNPAAAGLSFATICFPSQMFTRSMPLHEIVTDGGKVVQFTEAVSPAFTLSLGGVPQYRLVDMALGNYPGPMGATNILVILACLLYLIFRGTVRWELPVSFFITVSAFAFLFPRISVDRLESVAFELMAGTILFGGVFLLGDPVTTPKRGLSKVIFGIVTGICAMLFRRFGLLEEEFTFALLLMNASVWGIDMITERFSSILRRKRVEAVYGKKIQKKA